MSSVVAETFSQPSKAYTLSYILFSYAVIFSLISLESSGNDAIAYFIIVAIVGGFFGTFLFLLKPIEKIMFYYFNWRYKNKFYSLGWAFYSPYLTEAKGQVIGGLFFSLTCFMALVNSNFNMLTKENTFIIQIGLIIMGSIICISSLRKFNRLKRKIQVLSLYYKEVGEPDSARDSNTIYPTLIEDLRHALNRKDWDEAYIIEKKYKSLKQEKLNRRLKNTKKLLEKTPNNQD
jgi:hypothetical protein